MYTALVVDDDGPTRMVEKKLLEKHRFKIELTATNGKEAVDLFEAGNSFDLVVMDKEMPVMDGPKATSALRDMNVRCLIVGVTARTEQNLKAEFLDAGVDFCFVKPLTDENINFILGELAKK